MITIITKFVCQALDKYEEFLAVPLNISKAFDSVLNAGVLGKFKGYGVTGRISFLTSHLMRVMLIGHAYR